MNRVRGVRRRVCTCIRVHRRRVPGETMERGEFQSLNGIEISSQLGRQRQSRPERGRERERERGRERKRAGRRRLIPAAKVVPLYDRVYNTYTRRRPQDVEGQRRKEEEANTADSRLETTSCGSQQVQRGLTLTMIRKQKIPPSYVGSRAGSPLVLAPRRTRTTLRRTDIWASVSQSRV